MKIQYSETQEIEADNLQELFTSVGWGPAKEPERLQRAIKNSDKVYTAWDNKKLVGLINAISDGELTVFFHNLLVSPDYQRQGIGNELVEKMLKHYVKYEIKIINALEPAINFYKKRGFKINEMVTPMIRGD